MVCTKNISILTICHYTCLKLVKLLKIIHVNTFVMGSFKVIGVGWQLVIRLKITVSKRTRT